MHLEWIDLIFGYKQQGPEAVAANNVFYYLTYYGTVPNRENLEEELKQAIELQIAHFGQMPYQLFRSSHPKRIPLRELKSSVPRLISKCYLSSVYPSYKDLCRDYKRKGSIEIDARSNIQSFSSTSSQINLCNKHNQWTKPSSYEEKLITNGFPMLLTKFSLLSSTLNTQKANNIIIGVLVGNDRILTVLSNGVVEVWKYGTSDRAKQLIASYNSKLKSKQANRKSKSVASSSDSNLITEDMIGLTGGGSGSGYVGDAEDTYEELDDISSHTGSSHSNIQNNSSTNVESTSTSSVGSNSNTKSASTVIIYDDDLMMAMNVDSYPVPSPTPLVSNSIDVSTTKALKPVEIEEAILYLSKDLTHFELIPRILLAKSQAYYHNISALLGHPSSLDNSLNLTVHESASPRYQVSPLSNQLQFTIGNNLLLSAGFLDGRIQVSELDPLTGFIRTVSDYSQHHTKVIAIGKLVSPWVVISI